MNWGVAAKIAGSILGTALVAVGTTYTVHPDARAMAYLASVATAVGPYLLGLGQDKP